MFLKLSIQPLIVILAVLCGFPPAVPGDTARQVEKPVQQSITTRRNTQKAEEQWREEKEKLIALYEQLQQENEQFKKRKDQLQGQIAATSMRLGVKEKQLADIQQISTQIQPFLDQLLVDIKTHFAGDLPFLTDERRQRIQRLETLLADPQVQLSEKYRKAMEAVLIETEYGFTIETYQETIPVEGQDMLVDVFRLGRLNLYYQSLDGKQAGFYNVALKAWQPLDDTYNPAIGAAVNMAAKRQPVELLTLPLGRLVTQ